MRVFTLVLVVSPASLLHPVTGLEAARPTQMRRQGPAVVPLTADDERSPPNRLLRSQLSAVPMEGVFKGFNSASVMDVPQRIANDVEALRVFLAHHMQTVSMKGATRRFATQSLEEQPASDVRRLLTLLHEKDKQLAAKLPFGVQKQTKLEELSNMLIPKWAKEGKTSSQVLGLLGLRDRPLLTFLKEGSSTGVLKAYCKHIEKDRAEFLYLQTIVQAYGGRQGFIREMNRLFLTAQHKLATDFLHSTRKALQSHKKAAKSDSGLLMTVENLIKQYNLLRIPARM
ncbi:unnamed protein product [Hyaloperonospora brassicae]|uniref:RxLR effector candidate protein n=1 Tax=Hyaloperonospora brassicae TaxID=162125 RepID=A0AAV0SXK8_HYABA|nr:unnamed protein product [Hyaloperonospora brassicae]